MFNPKYQVRYDVFKPTDRDDTHWHGYIYDPATQKQKKWNLKETSKRKALQLVKQRIEQIYGSGGTLEDYTRQYDPTKVKSVLKRYLDEYYIPIKVADKPPHRQQKLIISQKALKKNIVRHLGDKSVMSLESDDIDQYIIKRKDEGAANGTINREIQMLKAAINRKVKKSSIVIDQIKKHAKLKENIKKGIISLEDFDRFVLKWEQVDFRECRLNFDWDEVKEGYDKSIKLSDELMIELQTLWKTAEKDDNRIPICPYCFQGPYRKNKLISERTYYLAWNDTCQRLGPPFIKLNKTKKNGKPESTFTPHDLRRTRITMGINAGENPKAIMKQTGHKTMQVFQRYNIVDNTDQDELVKRQIENDKRLRQKEQEIQQKYEERTAEAIKKLEDMYWTASDDQKEVLDDVVTKLKETPTDIVKDIDQLFDDFINDLSG
jgi:hypothetical protein